MSAAQLVQPLANGALVLALDTDFDGCMAIVQRLAEEEGVYLANSMNSLRLEGQKTLSIEIVQQFDWEVPDVVIIPGGNLGNVSALGAGFQMMLDLGLIAKRPRLVLAQAAAANPLYRAYQNNWAFEPVRAQPTLATAIQIGNPVSIHRAIAALQAFDGIVEQATENELADASAQSRSHRHVQLPAHGGGAGRPREARSRRGEVKKTDRVIVVSTANGLKFSEFKTGLSHAHAERRHPAARESAGGTARRLRPGAPGARPPAVAGGKPITWRALPPGPARRECRSKSGNSAAHRSPPPNRSRRPRR